MQRSEEKQAVGPAGSKRPKHPFRPSSEEREKWLSGQEPPAGLTPAKREASSLPRGSRIHGVHRIKTNLWAIEPGLTTKSFRELAGSLPEKQKEQILLKLLKFEHERLLDRISNYEAGYVELEAITGESEESTQLQEDLAEMAYLVDEHQELKSHVSWWVANVGEALRNHFGPDVNWSPQLTSGLEQQAALLEERRKSCDTSLKTREANFGGSLPGPAKFGESVRTAERVSSPAPDTPRGRPAVPVSGQTGTPTPASTVRTPSRTSTVRANPPSFDFGRLMSSTGLSKGKSDIATRDGSSDAASTIDPYHNVEPLTPWQVPELGTQGGRKQVRQRLSGPRLTEDEVEASFTDVVDALVKSSEGPLGPKLRDLRDAHIEEFKPGRY